MNIHLSSTLAVAMVLALLPVAGAAQEPADTVTLPELVVTATRVPVPRDVVPASVTVITGDEVRARGARTVQELLRGVAGASLARAGSFGAVTSLFLRGGENDYVRVLVDGVAVNQPGGAYDFANLSVDNVERIEVVRGPASVVHGSDAMTGVIQVFTRRGDGEPRLAGGLHAGSYGSVGWDAGLAGGQERAGYSLTFSRFTTDGVLEVDNEHAATVASGRVQLQPDDRTELVVSVRYAENEFHYPTDGAGRLVRRGVQLEDVTTLGVEVGHRLTDRLETRLVIGANDIGIGFDDESRDPDDPNAFSFHSLAAVSRRSADARAHLHLDGGTVLTAGLLFERQKHRSFEEFQSAFGPASSSMDVARWNRAYYAQAFARPLAPLSLDLGVRLEDNEAFGRFATYRAGAAFRLAGGTRLRAALGTGFKEPTFLENYATGFVRGNPELDPERARSWEFGLEHELLGSRLRLGGTYFDQRFRDLIQYTSQPFDSVEPNYFNVAAASASGVELEARVEPLAVVSLDANYTRLSTRVDDAGIDDGPGAIFVQGERLLRRPANTASLGAAYRRAAGGTVSVRLAYVGRRDDLDFADWPAERVTLPAYTRVDVAGEVPILSAGATRPAVTAAARVENLFGREYQEIANFPAPGRTISIGARLGAP